MTVVGTYHFTVPYSWTYGWAHRSIFAQGSSFIHQSNCAQGSSVELRPGLIRRTAPGRKWANPVPKYTSCHALLLFSDQSLNIIVHGWENNHSWWLSQAMHGSRVTPFWPPKYAYRNKSAMIVLSGHFKTLLFYQIFDVLRPSVITVDHCTLTHSSSIVCYVLSIAIDFCYKNTVVCPSSLIFYHNYNYIHNIKKMGIVCFRFHLRTPGLVNDNVCAAIVPFFFITFVSNKCMYPHHCFKILLLFKPLRPSNIDIRIFRYNTTNGH